MLIDNTNTRIATRADLRSGVRLVAGEPDCSFPEITLSSRRVSNDGWWFDGESHNGFQGLKWINDGALLRGRYRIPVDALAQAETAHRAAQDALLAAKAALQTARAAAVKPKRSLKWRYFRTDEHWRPGTTIVIDKKFSPHGQTYTYVVHKRDDSGWLTTARSVKDAYGSFDRVFDDLCDNAYSLDVRYIATKDKVNQMTWDTSE